MRERVRKPEKYSDEKIVETKGALSPKMRIERLLEAGENIQRVRQEQFEYKDTTKKYRENLPEIPQYPDEIEMLQKQKDTRKKIKSQIKESEKKIKEAKKNEDGSIDKDSGGDRKDTRSIDSDASQSAE
jgi:chromatin segregation and condensation protein Rec8/ScpA/Scc1 (kleisin family)